MSPDQENFEQLRRLLALKRHEQPPPGYFNNFSRQVIARIQAGEAAADSAADRWSGRSSWLRRALGLFEARPIVAGAFGMAVCAVLFFGIIFSEPTAPTGMAGAASAGQAETPGSLAIATPPPESPLLDRPVVVGYDQSSTGSVNSFQAQGAAIFEGLGMPKSAPATFSFPGR